MIDIFVLGLPFFFWLAAFAGIHIAVWVGEGIQRRKVERQAKEFCERSRDRQNDPGEER